MKRNLDEIYKYYKDLGIECFWTTDSLSLYEINLITDTFDELHKKYPEIIIEEIGDYYSIDKIKHDESVNSLKTRLETREAFNHEYYIENPNRVKESEIKLREFLKDLENKVVIIDDNKYLESDFVADYNAQERKIRFNHMNKGSLKGNVYHEFGHAIAYQYDINNNKDINEFFNSMDKYRIELFISEYATTSIKEFIAEVFAQYNLGNRNYIINKVMEIIEVAVLNEKAMSETEIGMKKIFDKYRDKF